MVLPVHMKGVCDMLVLSRKLNETIVIDGNIRITVVGIRGNQVRLGIEAPDSVGIFREELLGVRAGASERVGATGTGVGRRAAERSLQISILRSDRDFDREHLPCCAVS